MSTHVRALDEYHGDNVDFEPQPNAAPLPTAPSDSTQSFYRRCISFFRAFPTRKKSEAPQPAVNPSYGIWKSFTSLGFNRLGLPTPIDDRQNILQDAMLYMSSVSKDEAKNLNASAVALLSSKRPRPSQEKSLADRTEERTKKYPFARHITGNHMPSELPNAAHVFERLLSSNVYTSGNDHPNGLSSMTFALATIISLSLVRSNDEKPEYNETSPFLDLSPLYGVDDTESSLIRARDGYGMLSPDCFYEDRVTLLPPTVSVLLVLWNRNHNYIARRLFLNNERKKWVDPTKYPASSNGTLDAHLAEQDDEIFRIARSINCIQFKNVVSEDFLKVLMGLPNVGNSTNLNILADLKQSGKGEGYESSLEFSLLYNWSVLMGQADIEKAKAAIEEEFGESFDEIMVGDYKVILNGMQIHKNPNKRQRHHSGLIRDVTGYLRDEDLTKVLLDATDAPAGAPGARRIPSPVRAAEIMIIERARRQGVTSFNEFRKYLGLRAFKTFDEWNSNPEIARAAEALYGDVDRLELYPGLQAEEIAPGLGLNFGYTMTFGLLVDLVAIIRSDPCFTTDMTPGNLTRWGYGECMASQKNGAFGAMLPRLLQRNLPRNCAYNNIYTLFPLTCPGETQRRLQSIQDENPPEKYDLERPKSQRVVTLETKSTIGYVFHSPNFKTIYEKDLKTLTSGYGYFLGIEDKMQHDQELMMTMFALIPDKGALARYAKYFGKTATGLIAQHSKDNNGHKTIDIVKDVINATCTRWVCETLCGLPLEGPDAVADMHDKFGSLFAYVFRNIDPESAWASRETALKASEELRRCIDLELPNPALEPDETYLDFLKATAASISVTLARIRREFKPDGVRLPQQSAQTFLDRMLKSVDNFPLETGAPDSTKFTTFVEYENERVSRQRSRCVANVLGLAVVTSVNFAQACAQAVDFYLDEEYEKERMDIIRLSTLPPHEAQKPETNRKIMGYIHEAQRIGQPMGLWREALKDESIPQGRRLPPIVVKAGDRIFADFHKAHTDKTDFFDPYTVDLNRNTPSIQGMGLHKCPGLSFVDHTMPELFKAIFRLKDLRRDTGKAGRLERLVVRLAPNQMDPKVYIDSTGGVSHYPRSLTVRFKGDVLQKGSTLRTEKARWRVKFGHSAQKLRYLINTARLRKFLLLAIVFLLTLVFYFVRQPKSAQNAPSKVPKRPAPPPPIPAEIKGVPTDCPLPTTVFHPWNINSISLGTDGHPIALQYTLDHPKAHKLSVVDIDARDMRMAIYVDNELRGITRDFELNRTANCGENLKACITDGHSAGVVVVGPGNHTVKISWVGKEFANGTHEADWGEDQSRRFKMRREYCA